MSQFCPRCHRPDGEGCAMESLPGFHCPEPVEETDQTIVLACGPCGWLRGVPAAALIKGLKSDAQLPICRRDECQVKVCSGKPPEATPLQQAVDKASIAKTKPATKVKP